MAKGIVTRGRGRSDSVSLVGAEPVAQPAAPAKAPRKAKAAGNGTANLGFEAKLWLTADKLRNNMDAAEYKHVVLGLIFLKYISDSFEEHRAKLLAGEGDYEGANPEDPDEYKAENVFWVPAEARWSHLQANAKQPTIGKLVDDAMVAIERDNPRLKGVLPKDYARPGLDKQRLGELIDVIATIELTAASEGASEGEQTHRSVDLLGRVYEYFLTRFAVAEGKNGGQFYTPSCVVRCLVEMLEPYKGRIYDPCCGSGGMFVQSEKFVESHGGKLGDISIYGQESNATTRRLAVMNLALRGIEADFGPEHADSFRRDLHPDLRADYVLANPPFNDSDWFRKDDDVRWQFGVPPKGNANFAWVQHFIHHLAPAGHGRLRARQWQHELQPERRRRDPPRPDRGRPGGLHGGPARPALLQHPDPGVPLVPGQEQGCRRPTGLPRSARPHPVHRCPQARHPDRSGAPGAAGGRPGEDQRHLSPLAGCQWRGQLRRCAGVLQIRHHRRDRCPWPRAHAGAVCGGGGGGRRWRAVRGEDAAAGGGAGKPSSPNRPSWKRRSGRI